MVEHYLDTVGVGGSNPPSRTIFIERLVFSKDSFQFSFGTKMGDTHSVDYKNDLNDPAWTTLMTTEGNGLLQLFTDSGPLPPSRLYGVRRD